MTTWQGIILFITAWLAADMFAPITNQKIWLRCACSTIWALSVILLVLAFL